MQPVFVSWSGGKDSCLAGYRAVASGLKVCYLANTITEDGQHSRSHGLSAEVLRVQAQAIGIPLVQRPTTWDSYEAEFKSLLRTFKEEGIEGGVFGDIDFEEHRQWVERVCQEVGLVPYLPLWGENQDKILREFIGLGFESVVVAAKADLFGEEVLGRKVDLDFVRYLSELSETKSITPCGEAGEYHTLVLDGPIFKQRLVITEASKVLRDEHRFFEILSVALKARC